jgi:hypothetical protein
MHLRFVAANTELERNPDRIICHGDQGPIIGNFSIHPTIPDANSEVLCTSSRDDIHFLCVIFEDAILDINLCVIMTPEETCLITISLIVIPHELAPGETQFSIEPESSGSK